MARDCEVKQRQHFCHHGHTICHPKSGYVTTKLHGTSTCPCNNNAIFSDRAIFKSPAIYVCQWRIQGVFWLPGNPCGHDFFNQGVTSLLALTLTRHLHLRLSETPLRPTLDTPLYAIHVNLAAVKPWQFMPNWKDGSTVEIIIFCV